MDVCLQKSPLLYMEGKPSMWNLWAHFLKIFIAQKVYTVCSRTNYKTVSVTNLNKYLHYGTSENE